MSAQQRFAAHARPSPGSQSGAVDHDESPSGHVGEFIATVDVWQLYELKWPIMRVFTPAYVDHLELDHYLKHLLDTKTWREVYAVPHTNARERSKHVFDVYGQRT